MIFQQALANSLHIHADKAAIEYRNEKITYAQLSALAEKVTRRLQALHPEPETFVGVRLSDKLHVIAAMIGIMNARCAFVLLDPSMPSNRFAAINKDLKLQWMIVERTGDGPQGIGQLSFGDLLKEEPRTGQPLPEYDGDDSIYVYFTSGSTGAPKGIIGRNKSLLQFIQWEIKAFGIGQDCRVSQFISPYFDAFLRDVFVPLFAGGTLCIPPDDKELFTERNLISWIDRMGITLIHCVPSVFRLFNAAGLTPAHFSQLKYVLLSGEKIDPGELDNWYDKFHERIELVNFYGATETTMIRAYYRIRPEDAKASRIPIGRPIDDTDLLVLNKDMMKCPDLVVGDLYIASAYVSKGYLNNAALTNEVFTIMDIPGTGFIPVYRTGDRARRLQNGNIDLIGREDRQVKLNGIRIELDEIEHVILRSGMVKSAAVVVQPGSNRNETLVAYIVPSNASDQRTVDALYQYLESYLPGYMLPSLIRMLQELPLLHNGKTNYTALRDEVPDVEVVEPENEIERALVKIWKEILGERAISTRESFLRSGGNSLGIMQLMGHILDEFNVRISLNDIFQHLTIQQQACLIRQATKSNIYIISPTAGQPYYRVSSAQKRVYWSYELNKERVSYNLPMAWEFGGRLDAAFIGDLFSRLIERHEALRTCFLLKDRDVVQEICPRVDFKLELYTEQGGNMPLIIDAFIRPFDLSRAPLIRAAIVRTESEVDVLMVDLHHIVCDGISQTVLRADFEALYAGMDLKPLAIQYRDYAEWEHRFRSTEDYLSQRTFWLQQFEDDVPKLNLPVVRVDETDLSDRGGNILFRIMREELQPLVDYLYAEDLTLFAGIFSIYFVFVAQLSGQEDIVIGVTSSGRTQIELENVVGMFVKVLPVRFQIDPSGSLQELIVCLYRYMARATSNQYFDLSDIMAALNASRSGAVKRLFDVAFVYGNLANIQQRKVIRDPAFSPYVFENKNSKFPITLYVGEDDTAFNCRLEYSEAYFQPSDAQRLADQFVELALRLGQAPGQPLMESFGATAPAGERVDEDIQFNF